MMLGLMGMAMLDGGIAEVFQSPFVIPVAGCAMIACIVISGAWARVRAEEIKSHERLARIAQGLPVDPTWDDVTVRAASSAITAPHSFLKGNDGSGARRAGVVLVSIGLGLFLFFGALAVIVHVRQVLAGGAAGILPLAIGVGFLWDARMKKEEYERRLAMQPLAMSPEPMPVGASTAPPPPPLGMTPAQASDWRPLH